MKNSIEEPNTNLSENNISSDNTENAPEVINIASDKEISPLLRRIPGIRYTLIDAVKSSITRNGITRKIPLNSRGEVIGNLLHFIAAKEMNMLKDEDFIVVDVPDEKLPEHVLLDIFLNLQLDRTRLSLIAAEFYHELCEINMQARALSMRIGLNTRKEVAALIGMSETYLGQALRLKRNNPRVFYLLMNTEYTFNDVKKITDIQEYNPGLFKRMENLEITLHQAWYKLDKKSKKKIESKPVKEVQTNALADYMEDAYENKEYLKELEKREKQKLDIPAEIEMTTDVTNADIPDEDDEDFDPYPEFTARREKEDYNRFLNKIIDEEGSRTTIQNILTRIDKNKEDFDKKEEWYEENDFEIMPLNKYPQFRRITDAVLMEMYYGKKTTNEVPESTTEPVATDNNIEKDGTGEEHLENKGIDSNSELRQVTSLNSSYNSIFNWIDAIFADNEYWVYKDVAEEDFSYPFANIEQVVWDKQKENLNWLIENGKIHQHKKVRRNIGNILLKFENKEPKVISNKHISLILDLLDSSVRISSTGYKVAKKLAEHIKDLTLEERAELELVGKKIDEIENTIQDYIFFQ